MMRKTRQRLTIAFANYYVLYVISGRIIGEKQAAARRNSFAGGRWMRNKDHV